MKLTLLERECDGGADELPTPTFAQGRSGGWVGAGGRLWRRRCCRGPLRGRGSPLGARGAPIRRGCGAVRTRWRSGSWRARSRRAALIAAQARVIPYPASANCPLGDTETDAETQTETEGYRKCPPLYAHMPPPVLRSHAPGRRPRTPGKNLGPCSSLPGV